MVSFTTETLIEIHDLSMTMIVGLVRTLKALSLGNNNIRFPPPTVVNRGVTEILKHLRHILLAKSNGNFKPGNHMLYHLLV